MNVNYMNEAFIVSSGVVQDVINPEKGNSGTPSLYTDGNWFGQVI